MQALELTDNEQEQSRDNNQQIDSPYNRSSQHVADPDDLLNLREVKFGTDPARWRYPRNAVNNQKYTALTFLPLVLFNQFKYFFNLFFLLVALS